METYIKFYTYERALEEAERIARMYSEEPAPGYILLPEGYYAKPEVETKTETTENGETREYYVPRVVILPKP